MEKFSPHHSRCETRETILALLASSLFLSAFPCIVVGDVALIKVYIHIHTYSSIETTEIFLHCISYILNKQRERATSH